MEKQNKPLLIDNINFNNINIDRLDIESNTRKNLYLKYNNNDLILQIPELLYTNELKEREDYYEIIIDIVCRNKEKTNNFIDFLDNLDKYFISLISKNKNKYFNNKKIKYKSILRDNNNNKFIKLKLLKYNINNNILRIVNNSKSISLKELNKECYIKILININAIWINDHIFGIYLKPILINIRPILHTNISFIKDSENEKIILDSSINNNIKSINNIDSSMLKPTKLISTEKVIISNNNSTKINNSKIDSSTEKVLISNNNSTKINNKKLEKEDTSTVSISSMSDNNAISMSEISFTTLDNIAEYNNDTKNESVTSS